MEAAQRVNTRKETSSNKNKETFLNKNKETFLNKNKETFLNTKKETILNKNKETFLNTKKETILNKSKLAASKNMLTSSKDEAASSKDKVTSSKKYKLPLLVTVMKEGILSQSQMARPDSPLKKVLKKFMKGTHKLTGKFDIYMEGKRCQEDWRSRTVKDYIDHHGNEIELRFR